MNRKVVGLVGPIASGKGHLAEYLKNKGFLALTLSDRLREEADRRGWTRSRDNLVKIGNQWRSEHGPAILAQKSIALIPQETDLVVIEGIRNPGELFFLRDNLGAIIISVDAPVEYRLRWYLARAIERGEDGATAEDFYRVNARDLGEGEDSSGQQGGECLRLADIKLFNDGTPQFLVEGRQILERHLQISLEGAGGKKEVYKET